MPHAVPKAPEVLELDHLLRAQWLRLRDWIDRLDLAVDARASTLTGWTVAELVAHLGRGLVPLSTAQAAAPGVVPLSLAEYVATYPGRADGIRDETRELAARIADDPLPEVERMAAAAFDRLAELRALGPDPVVRATRGPVLLSTLVTSRLLELVAHADDLVRSTHLAPGDPGPLEAGAVAVVADALLDVLVARGGPRVEVADDVAWLRIACGRVPLGPASLQAALRPAPTGDPTPDLGRLLPLL